MNLPLLTNRALVLTAMLLALGGCSVQQLAVDRLGDAISQSGGAFATDDDPELIRAAAPFSLKLIESLLAESPEHKGLLLAGARGFTQYAYAFLQQEAEESEEHDIAHALRLEDRARRLYRRARDYGLRGLALRRPDFLGQLRADPRRAVTGLSAAEVPLLYWTGASWGALIGLSKNNPDVLGELPIVEAMMDRALELDETFDRGAIHTFLIGYESVRQGRAGDPAERARQHFTRAMELSGGVDAAPLLALAEAVCVPQQRRAEFEALLQQALRVDLDRASENRLANLVAQRRARWLLSRTEHLFTN
ncbi:MAG TPA: TRAP transporter TatT component family protein [Burkholderiales bacterium]|nr:TRAP transporter TatT component family protein [Burkholderiales bacterium]